MKAFVSFVLCLKFLRSCLPRKMEIFACDVIRWYENKKLMNNKIQKIKIKYFRKKVKPESLKLAEILSILLLCDENNGNWKLCVL